MKKDMCTGSGLITGKTTFEGSEGALLLMGPIGKDIDEVKITMKNAGGMVVYYGPTAELTTENSMTLDPKETIALSLSSGESLYVLASENGHGVIRVCASIL